jgi:hypothetical protein
MLILSLPTCVHRACLNVSFLFITHSFQRTGVYVHSLILISPSSHLQTFNLCDDDDCKCPPAYLRYMFYCTINGWCIILGTRRRYENIKVTKALKGRKQSNSHIAQNLVLVSLLSAIGYLRSIFCCPLPVVLLSSLSFVLYLFSFSSLFIRLCFFIPSLRSCFQIQYFPPPLFSMSRKYPLSL